MTFDKLYEAVRKATDELMRNGLDHAGYEIQIELSINSYRELLCDRDHYFAIKIEVDDVKERVHRGTIYGTPFILTEGTDRVVIAKVFEVGK